MYIQLYRRFTAIALVAMILAIASGCCIMGAAAGARIDNNAMDYVPVELDSLATVAQGDTIRVCVHEFRGQRKHEQAIFQSFDPDPGVIHGLNDQTEVSYVVSDIEGVELVHKAGMQHTGKAVGFAFGLAIDFMLLSNIDDINLMGDLNIDWSNQSRK